ncbi:MAG: endonuclease/exonuclease/phosphatase family protein [Clostridia bacterium]|nr:endonuclease/exonuclease/phosphatase family protein [Clostridia bacterium]
MKKKLKWWQTTLAIIAGIITLVILVVGVYVIYISAQYYRIEDNQEIQINNNQSTKVQKDTIYSISTYNIGFGAYTKDFSFFMDTGETLDGQYLTGTGSIAKDKNTVIDNTRGSIDTIKQYNVDFALFQEVDVKATRSHKYNQFQAIKDSFNDYSASISMNFHSAYLCYPLFNAHGKTDAGIVTLSRYNISSATRRSLPIDESFPTKFFDLDRCIQVTRLPIDNSEKELVIINVHLSAYDEGGVIRQQQLTLLNEILSTEYAAGNYVIAGGDFNHDIASSIGIWPTNRKTPEWVYQLDNSQLSEGYRFVSSNNAPTCRSTDGPYVKGESYLVVLDGFICSDNIETININNIDTDFEYSDHNPAILEFKLV